MAEESSEELIQRALSITVAECDVLREQVTALKDSNALLLAQNNELCLQISQQTTVDSMFEDMLKQYIISYFESGKANEQIEKNVDAYIECMDLRTRLDEAINADKIENVIEKAVEDVMGDLHISFRR